MAAPDYDELQRIWDLREKGAISEEEYSRLKRQILGPSDEPAQSSANQPEGDAPLAGTDVESSNEASGTQRGKAIGIGCAAIFLVVLTLAAIGGGGSNNSTANTMNVDENLATTNMNLTALDMNVDAPKAAYGSEDAQTADEELEQGSLTTSQANAVRSAEQYLSMTGFSRDGLIDQLSSDAGDGYSISDATAAVDSLNVDWNENAARSARQYLSMSGFSCDGLIDQLSSRAGDKYTVEQATYGARQAGAC